MLKENEKLKVERTKTRTGSGLFAKRPEANTQQFKQAVGNLFAGAGISFEEFAKEKNQEESASTKSREEDMVSPKISRRGFTPINFKDRKRSGFGSGVGSEKSEN